MISVLKNISQIVSTTRFKTTLWYVFVFTLLELLLGFGVYFYLYKNLNESLDASLLNQATAIKTVVIEKHIDIESFTPDSLFTSEEDLMWDIIYDAVALNRRNTFIQISRKGKIIFKSASLFKRQLSFQNKTEKMQLFDYRDSTLSESSIRCAVANEEKFQIIVAFPKEHIIQTLDSLKNLYLFLAPIFLLISIFGGAIISANALSRIDRIIKKTEEITAQNLDQKIEGEQYHDEYGRLVRTMNKMIQRIKLSVDYMNQFSLSAAHELKTPLTILRGELEVSLKSTKTPDAYKEILESNYEETLRLIKIVDNLFFIAKVDHAKIQLIKTETNAKQFLNPILQNLKILGKEKNISFSLECDEDVQIIIDKETMQQVITNLVDNAIKYGEENQTVLLVCAKEENKIHISITNKGEGIPAEELPNIFNRFYRVENSRNRKTGGIGLGLSVVKSIVEWHGGNISVDSVPNAETTFTVSLPV